MIIFILISIIAFLLTIILILIFEMILLKETKDRYFNQRQKKAQYHMIQEKRKYLKFKRFQKKGGNE